ncbi:baculoviral IAP repeat-containing protein 3-like isoform X1 [Neocloeon triangulifer]|uniref:baculoviral IAP repeat-containing protein 3-like isoform X1 n=1 Tax=Neocloeon triangulifer TaxID=2078957 RepID=UPI00286F4D91|nr:baculoviral IAP repeat-containing protein 3-like isoform X1 [Neocloeon triangulifer]
MAILASKPVSNEPTRQSNKLRSINHEICAPLRLNIALHRLFTFPACFEVEPGHLAEAGLFYRKTTNSVICWFCECEFKTSELDCLKGKNANEILQMKSSCSINHDSSGNIPIGNISKIVNYKFESHRLYSLLQKKDWEFVKPVELAASGFYYAGVEDSVRCIYCNLEVRGWEEGDTPKTEHIRWNPNCPFLKQPDSVVNIKIGHEQTEAYSDGIGFNKIGSNPFSPLTGFPENYKMRMLANDPFITPSDLSIQQWNPPRHPERSLILKRMESFKNWPKGLSQTPDVLAKAGFFYTGCGDRVICFQCSLGLKDWAQDDEPFTEHAKWNQGCQYLIMQKGSDFIQQMLHGKISKINT